MKSREYMDQYNLLRRERRRIDLEYKAKVTADNKRHYEAKRQQYTNTNVKHHIDRKRYALQNCINHDEFDVSGFTDEQILELDVHFHHINPGRKKFDIGCNGKTINNKDLQSEVRKCVALTFADHMKENGRQHREAHDLYIEACKSGMMNIIPMLRKEDYELIVKLAIFRNIISPRYTTIHDKPNIVDESTGVSYYAPFLEVD